MFTRTMGISPKAYLRALRFEQFRSEDPIAAADVEYLRGPFSIHGESVHDAAEQRPALLVSQDIGSDPAVYVVGRAPIMMAGWIGLVRGRRHGDQPTRRLEYPSGDAV